MTRTNLFAGAARWALFIGLAATPLAGCNQSTSSTAPSGALPLVDSASETYQPAPSAASLPSAPPVRVGRVRDPHDYYAYTDQAYAMNDAFGNAPPDYGFSYDGAQPWVWRSADGAMRVAEVLAGGGDRYYYYAPGADYPYLVRDPEYTYAYDDGALVVIYDSRGRPLSPDQFDSRRDYASRFYYRGQSIYSGAHQQPHQGVAQQNWAQQLGHYEQDQQRWHSDQTGNPDWRSYHDAHQPQYVAQYAGERAQRETYAVQIDLKLNNPTQAARDQQAAQEAQKRAQAAGAPPAGGIFHVGGPRTPDTGPTVGGATVPTPAPGASMVQPTTGVPPQGGLTGGGAGSSANEGHHHDHGGGGAPGAAGSLAPVATGEHPQGGAPRAGPQAGATATTTHTDTTTHTTTSHAVDAGHPAAISLPPGDHPSTPDTRHFAAHKAAEAKGADTKPADSSAAPPEDKKKHDHGTPPGN